MRCLPTSVRRRLQSWSWVTFSKSNPTQNFWTQPNPQKSSPDPTQPIIDTWYGILGYTASYLYALKTLKTHGLCGQALWEVTQAVLVAQLLYASPAWSGFLKADETISYRWF